MVADLTIAVKSPLDHGLGADEHAITELHCLRMLKDNVGSNLQINAGSPANRADENPAHQRIQGPIPSPEPRKKVDQFFLTVRIGEEGSQVSFPKSPLALFLAPEGS
jgi:hypothetical protein